jgi:beta-N-acetylhexosaminidase
MPASHADALRELLLIELEEGGWSASLERWLRTQRPGGIVFSHGRPRSAEASAALVMRITATLGFLPFLALEEDGGKSSFLRDLLLPLPSPRAAARAGPPTVRRLGELVGAGMKLLGFNTNFAPVLDLLTPTSAATLSPRAFSGDAHEVGRCAEAFVRGLKSHRVLACGKHFPGLSAAQPTAGDALPVVGKTMAELWREDLVPYRELIDTLPLVMLSHCAYKAYDFDGPRPAALSSGVVTGLLRVKLGYDGIAVADLRPSPATGALTDLGDLAAQSMVAGCDILVAAAGSAGKALTGLRRALELGILSTLRVDQSLKRVRAARGRLLRPGGKVRKAAVDQLMTRFERFRQECQAEEQTIA